jgi:putative FmdB family regulatory protein
MPIYEYYCPECAAVFEERRPMAEREAAAGCPTCGADSQRMLSMFTAFGGERGGRRALAGGPSCGSCTPTPSSCASCGLKR